MSASSNFLQVHRTANNGQLSDNRKQKLLLNNEKMLYFKSWRIRWFYVVLYNLKHHRKNTQYLMR